MIYHNRIYRNGNDYHEYVHQHIIYITEYALYFNLKVVTI
jgi:hypothetical protein